MEGTRLLEKENALASEEASLLKMMEAIPGGYADVYNKLGLINSQRGDLSRAAGFFKKALFLNPHYTEASLNLTITLNDLGEYDEARKIISKAALSAWADPNAIDPYIRKKMANEHAKLGDQYVELGMLDEGVEQYRKALGLSPGLVDIMTKLGMALRNQGEVNEAIELLAQAERLHPTYVPARIQLGLTYYMKGFFDLAFSKWEEASHIEPSGAAARVYLGLAQRQEVLN